MAERNKIADAQSHIGGPDVARMIMEFHNEFRHVYPTNVMASSLCAVGSGFLSGPGFAAYGKDFPPGTVFRLRAEVILPEPEAGS